MLRAYQSGDVYLASGVAMGIVPGDATKETHANERAILKVWLLSAQYGATAGSLVKALSYELLQQIPSPHRSAEDFIERHFKTYRRYWKWAEDRVQIFLHETHCEETMFGWKHRIDRRLKRWQRRTQALNFPMQAVCAEILRWAAVYAVEAGVEVQATVHDALVVGGATERAEKIVKAARDCMDRASEMIIGFAMRTDSKIVKYPDRFSDPRGVATWKIITGLLNEVENEPGAHVRVQTFAYVLPDLTRPTGKPAGVREEQKIGT
jgi:DNA polymerase I-like protein with 3'-5' exonuclease and polymerase domains